MLAVIADDFTGASEIAGIAFAQGFDTLIQTGELKQTDSDVLVVATNMRAASPREAECISAQVTEHLLSLGAELIFKKIDSVLRGNIGPELHAQMRVEKKLRSLLIPANPSRSRTISDGVYFIEDTEVADSEFAQVDHFPYPSSRVVDILEHRGARNVLCISPNDGFSCTGLHVGNTRNSDDLKTWASRVDEHLVPAGAADFFEALLRRRGSGRQQSVRKQERGVNGKALYVCGSTFPASRRAVREADSQNADVVCMPDEAIQGDATQSKAIDTWARRVISAFVQQDRVFVAASSMPTDKPAPDGGMVSWAMSEVARRVVKTGLVDHLLIEGGETSQAVMSALKIDSLRPWRILAPGVTCMQAENYPDLRISTKPGSYAWPDMTAVLSG